MIKDIPIKYIYICFADYLEEIKLEPTVIIKEETWNVIEDNDMRESVGEGLFSCSKCSYVAIDSSWLDRHMAFKHKHSCEQCDYMAPTPRFRDIYCAF